VARSAAAGVTGGRDLAGHPGERGAIYRRIGVEPIVNASTTMTRFGGSLMPAAVLEAMRQAAECFVDVVELQESVGRRIAQLTRNEAAFVSGGAAAGLFLSAVAAMARDTEDGVLRLHEPGPVPLEFVIHGAQRYPHEDAVELAGGRLVEVGSRSGTSEDELRRAIGARTAAILFVAGAPWAAGALPLEVVVHVGHERLIPVIVDAAAQLPPIENLWRLTAAGADLVIFSGGKGLCGPASTGLVLGRSELVRRVAANASPHERMGRPMKVGKEDLIGILAAVEWYLGQDHDEIAARYEAMVGHLVEWGATRTDVDVVRDYPGEAGQPTPRALIRLLGPLATERDRVMAQLLESPPRIAVEPAGRDAMHVAPETLLPGEEAVVGERLAAVLDAVTDDGAGA
jgi:D-glucosaminate-6-phosphate ammonia-lyase